MVSCSSDDKGDGDSSTGGSGGETAGEGGSGGDMSAAGSGGETGGSSGTETGGSGGETAGEGGSAGEGGEGGGGGEPADIAPACAVTQGTNDGTLSVMRPEISARKLGALAASQVVRIDRDPTTGDIVYMNMGGGFWKVDPATGTSSPIDMHYPGGNNHRGMAFGSDGTLYVLSHIQGADIGVVISKGMPDGNGGRIWSTIATSVGYPAGGGAFDHRFAGLAVSPDGQWLYFGSGSRSDHGEVEGGLREVPLTSAIFRVPTSGDNILLQNDDAALAPYLYADGLRNPYELTFNPAGDLISTENGPDIDIPEELNWIREGKHYGFPWRLSDQSNPVLDPTFTGLNEARLHVGYDNISYTYDATFPAAPTPLELVDPIVNYGPDADKFRSGPMSDVEDASDKGTTLAGVTPHRSPLGLSFDSAGTLCGDYYKSGFMLSFGAFLPVFGEQDHGEDLLLVQLQKVAGEYQMHATQLVTGFFGPVDSVLVGNKLYVVEFSDGAGGSLYEITFPLPEAAP
jgi:hypothetical protein